MNYFDEMIKLNQLRRTVFVLVEESSNGIKCTKIR